MKRKVSVRMYAQPVCPVKNASRERKHLNDENAYPVVLVLPDKTMIPPQEAVPTIHPAQALHVCCYTVSFTGNK